MSEVETKTFLVSYGHEGDRWTVELAAHDFDDAEARLAKLPFAKIDGELIAKVPASIGLVARLATVLRNALLMRRHG